MRWNLTGDACIALCLVAGTADSDSDVACSPNAPEACVESAQALESSGASAGDHLRALEHYRKACGWGHTPACVLAGRRLRSAANVPTDLAGAAELFRSACDRGNGEGCNMLGIMADHGQGIPEDDSRARSLFERACNDGWGWGCHNLAAFLRNGEGGPQDLAAAAAHYQTACDNGIFASCVALGNLYWGSKGVDQDRLRANTYYAKACNGDSGWGCYNLGTSYRDGEGVPAKDAARAASLLRTACERGVARACNLAGVMHHDGEAGATDRLLAFALFHKACDDGYHWGCHNAAKMYRDGRDIGRDAGRAAALYRKACDGEITESCEALTALSTADEPHAASRRQTAHTTATPRPTPAPRLTGVETAVASTTQWPRNCRAAWKAGNELVFTVSLADGQDEEATLGVRRRALVALLDEVDASDEPEIERQRQRCQREIERAPAYDNPIPSFLGGHADLTITPALKAALAGLWELIERRARERGEACPRSVQGAG